MKQLALISCGKSKVAIRAQAKSLYTGALFQKSLLYAERFCDHAVILSAKHHLVELDTMLDPYDLTLNDMSRMDRWAWAEKVRKQLFDKYPQPIWSYVYLTGENYLNNLPEGETPMKGMPIGRRLAWLNDRIK